MDTSTEGPANIVIDKKDHERPPAAVDGSHNMNHPTKFVNAHRRAMSKTQDEHFTPIDKHEQQESYDKVTKLQQTRQDHQGQFNTLQHPNKTATTASGESPHKGAQQYLTNHNTSSQKFAANQLRGQSGVSIKKRSNNFGSIGMGIVHEKTPSYLNVYINPVFTAGEQKMGRTQSRALRKRIKRNHNRVIGGTTNFIDQKSDADNSYIGQVENTQHSVHQQDVLDQSAISNNGLAMPNRSTNDLSPKTYQAPFVHESQEGSAVLNSSRHQNSVMGMQSVTMAKKLREQKEGDVKKLHNRIALLQAEEEKALKRIEETRYKAQQMLENKMQQDQYLRERAIFKEKALQEARDYVASKREEQFGITKQRKILVFEKNKIHADNVRDEQKKLFKQKVKIERAQLSKARERRIEQQILMEASKIKNEQFLVNRLENQKRSKDEQIKKEGKIIIKKEKQSRKLEILEAEVLKRLRDTHIKQQQAIEEIQDIFNNRHSLDPNMQIDGEMYPQNSQLGGHRSSHDDMDHIQDMNHSFEDNTHTYPENTMNQGQIMETHPEHDSTGQVSQIQEERYEAQQAQQLENEILPQAEETMQTQAMPAGINPPSSNNNARQQTQESIDFNQDPGTIVLSQGNHKDTMKTVKAKKVALIGQDSYDDEQSAANQTKGVVELNLQSTTGDLPIAQNKETEGDDLNNRQNTLPDSQIKKDSKTIETGEQIVVQQTENQ